jgi:DNA modification methylase
MVVQGDCLEKLKELEDNSVDSVVTDPPYGLSKEPDVAEVMRHWIAGDKYEHTSKGFMGKSWDSFVPGPEYWREVYRVLKPGGHILVFAGTRTWDLMSIALRFAGFQNRDTIASFGGGPPGMAWTFGSGFPKSHDVSKAIDKMHGAEREVVGTNPNHRLGESLGKDPGVAMLGQPHTGNGSITAPSTPDAIKWQGWGTALKPAWETILVFRKPLDNCTIAENVLKWGVGGLNIDESRIEGEPVQCQVSSTGSGFNKFDASDSGKRIYQSQGRWPANVILSCDCPGSEHGQMCAVHLLDEQSGELKSGGNTQFPGRGTFPIETKQRAHYKESGGASRFFYVAKSSKKDRSSNGVVNNTHPTCKPTKLMQYLIKLITPPGGIVLDPFAGSGSTGVAAKSLGFEFIGIEMNEEYVEIAERRIASI